ncbi:MAG TPA: hypothetical protein VFV72_05265 [Candidatus Limnocylindrales bacterium]|nr:hypothetical protein [Candidatus Limnocylindrales bacterium]
MRRERRRLALVIALLGLAEGCSPAATPPAPPAQSAATDPGPSDAAQPVASAPFASDPGGAEPGTVTPSFASDAVAWIPIGKVARSATVDELVATDAGYLAIGHHFDDMSQAAWFSPDGSSWSEVHPYGRRCGAFPWVTDVVPGDRGILVVGQEARDVAGGGACEGRLVAWLSTNGHAWERSFGTDEFAAYDAFGAWATPDGWEVAIGRPGDAPAIWSSDDGLTWAKGASMRMVSELYGLTNVAVDSAGTRLVGITVDDLDPDHAYLTASTDGRTWNTVLDAAADGAVPSEVIRVPADPPYWLAHYVDQGGDRVKSTAWVSRDLETWTSATLPRDLARSVEWTSLGLLALAQDACAVTGSSCDEPDRPPVYVVSNDGLIWSELPAAIGPDRFTDGPSGVLGVTDDASLWRLEALSPDEAHLLAGFRPDARISCAPRRADLPAGAVAGVECAPDGAPASQLGAYLFETQDALLSAYFDRLDTEGIDPRTGACPESEGDAAYSGGDEGSTFVPQRFGCFVNDFGVANLRFTVPDALVYVGVLGEDDDLPPLYDWAWEGNLDEPGAPTVWGEPAR